MIDPKLRDDAPVPITNRVLRQFAGLWILFFGGLACWEGFMRGHPTMATVWAVVAVLVGPLGLVIPAAIRPVFVGMMTLTAPIGWVVSHLLLAVLFYVVFTSFALFFKLIGRDALTRRFRPDLDTYWTPKPAASDLRSYFRQS